MMEAKKSGAPKLICILGPNGAGKTTLYRNEISQKYPDVPFVNADELVLAQLGHYGANDAEKELGQSLAEDMRRQLMAERRSMAIESTWSHKSKNEFLDEALSSGYRVLVYHVNVRDADLAVARVDARVEAGGHPVEEDRIRGRYERNQALIREAVLKAERAIVYDNSSLNEFHSMAIAFKDGRVQALGAKVPLWARELYREELARFAPEQLNSPRNSFDEARAFAHASMGDGAKTFTAKNGGVYTGPVVGETPLHVIQQVGPKTAIAHFRDRLLREVSPGERVTVTYTEDGRSADIESATLPARRVRPENALKAEAFRSLKPAEAVKQYPDLAEAYTRLRIFEVAMGKLGHPASEDQVASVREQLAQRVAEGRPFPRVEIRELARDLEQAALPLPDQEK